MRKRMPGFLEILFELNWMFLSQDCLLVVASCWVVPAITHRGPSQSILYFQRASIPLKAADLDP